MRSDTAERYPLVLALNQAGSVVGGSAGCALDDLSHARVTDGVYEASTGHLRLRLESVHDVAEEIELEGVVMHNAFAGRFTYNGRGTGTVHLHRDQP